MPRLFALASTLLIAAASAAQPVVHLQPDLAPRLGSEAVALVSDQAADWSTAPDARPSQSRVSATGAVLLSVGATLLPLALASVAGDETVSGALVVSGLALGPSLGNAVQGQYRSAAVGTGIRLAGLGLVGAGFGSALHGEGGDGDALLLAGGATLLAGGLYDLVTAERATQRVRVRPTADLRSGAAGATVHVGL